MYLPFKMSQHHWQRHSTSQQSSSSATAMSRAQQLSTLLSGPSVGPLPEFVAALDEMTYPVQRLNAWKAVWAPLLNNVTDKARTAVPAELLRLWREEIYPDLIAKHKQSGSSGGATKGFVLLWWTKMVTLCRRLVVNQCLLA